MKLLFVFCFLSAGCVILTEASPFFFNLQKSIIPQNIQIQRQRQPVVSQGVNFGFGSIISKWFPSIIINKQIGTRRPKPTQRPVIEVTTDFVPVDIEKEDESTSAPKAPAEIIDIYSETTFGLSQGPVEAVYEVVDVEENSPTTTSTTTTTEKPSVEKYSYTEEKTTSTTTAVPFEEIEPFTESKTTTTTTELPFEETEPLPVSFSSTTIEATAPLAEIQTKKTTTELRFGETEPLPVSFSSTSTEAPAPLAEIKTSTTTTTTELPIEETEPLPVSFSSTTIEATAPLAEIKTKNPTTELRFDETEPLPVSFSSTTTEAPAPLAEIKTKNPTTELRFDETEPLPVSFSSTTTEANGVGFAEIKTSTTTTELPFEVTESLTESKYQTTIPTEVYKPFTEKKTSTQSPITVPKIETQTTTNAESLVNEIGFRTEGDVSSTSAEVIQPSVEYLPSGSDKEELASIKPTTYRPVFVPTTTSTTTTTLNAPWKETPTNLINTGGIVDSNKPPDSYLYVRPAISVDDILFNEVSPNARPFQTLSVIGTTNNGNRVERIYEPQANSGLNERPRVTFYSNY